MLLQEIETLKFLKVPKAKADLGKQQGDKTKVTIDDLHNEHGFLRSFLDEVEILNSKFCASAKRMRDIILIQSHLLEFYEKDKSEELYEIYETVRINVTAIMNSIKDLGSQLEKTGLTIPHIEKRICFIQLLMLRKKISDYMMEHHDLQNEFKTKYKERIQRQMNIANIQSSNRNQIDGSKPEVFLQSVMPDVHIATRTLQYIAVRNQQLLFLERSLRKLKKLILNLSILLESHTELLSRIDYSIKYSTIQLESANEELILPTTPEEHKTKNWKYGLILSSLVFTFVVLVISLGNALK